MEYLVKKKTIKLIDNNNYKFTCFDILQKYIDINLIYNILNNSNLLLLNNILKYINIQWTLITKKLSEKYENNIYKNLKIINKCNNFDEFDEIINNFINGNLTLALVLINIIHNYLSFN